jgi:hypothetical protein
MQALTGSELAVNGGIWTNNQTIQNNAGTLLFEGGTVINGGAVSADRCGQPELKGNSTINAPVTNSSSGVISVLNNSGSTIGGTLTNPASGQVTIGLNASLALTGSTLSNAGTITLNGRIPTIVSCWLVPAI